MRGFRADFGRTAPVLMGPPRHAGACLDAAEGQAPMLIEGAAVDPGYGRGDAVGQQAHGTEDWGVRCIHAAAIFLHP